MTQPPPRVEYTRRMHRVQQHIDQHLGEALELADMAAMAHAAAQDGSGGNSAGR